MPPVRKEVGVDVVVGGVGVEEGDSEERISWRRMSWLFG